MRDASDESDPSGEALQAIEVVLVDATDLAYACHAYQFVCALDEALGRAKYWPSMFRRGNETALLAVIYTSHMDLIISAGYCLDDQPYSLLRKGRLSSLPPASISSLRGPLRLIFDALPFASSYERADICREHLAPITDPLAERKRRDSHQALWTERFHGLRSDPASTNLTAVRDGHAQLSAAVEKWFDIALIRPPEFRLRPTSERVASYYGVSPDAIVHKDSDATPYDHLEHFCERGALLASALPAGDN